MKRRRLVIYCILIAVCFTTFVLYTQQLQRDVGLGILDDWLEPVELPPSSNDELVQHSDDKPNEFLVDFPQLPTIYEIDFPDLKIPEILRTARYAILASKLHAFLSRPILTHGQAVEQNERDCPLRVSDLLVNPDQLNGDGHFWREEVGVDVIAEKRVDLVKWLAEKAVEGEQIAGVSPVGRGKRGIVVTGGNQDTTLRTLTLLRVLKELNVSLPIEVVHFPGEMKDLKQRRQVEELGGTLVEVRGVSKAEGVWKNFQIKGLAITESSFDEVLYLDSDNIPLRDPTHLFEAEIYKRDGRAAFWPDLSKDHAHNAIWRVVGEDCSLDYFTFESGQIVIDKRGNDGLNLAALWIASGMMNDMYVELCGGDKDTFRWAFRILGIPFGVAPRWMSPLGFLDGEAFCGHTMLQYDLTIPENYTEPPPLFVHSNLIKHLGSWGLGRGSTFTHLKRMTFDAYREPTLNYAHLWVYHENPRGMCTNLDLHSTAKADLSDEDLARQKSVLLPLSELEGNPFEHFDNLFWNAGGRIGGW